eukprot:364733-Chlamydomonas_euryale.AAC.1
MFLTTGGSWWWSPMRHTRLRRDTPSSLRCMRVGCVGSVGCGECGECACACACGERGVWRESSMLCVGGGIGKPTGQDWRFQQRAWDGERVENVGCAEIRRLHDRCGQCGECLARRGSHAGCGQCGGFLARRGSRSGTHGLSSSIHINININIGE